MPLSTYIISFPWLNDFNLNNFCWFMNPSSNNTNHGKHWIRVRFWHYMFKLKIQLMAQNIGYWQLQSKNNGISLQNLTIWRAPFVCGWGTSVDSIMYPNRGRCTDSERATVVCPFISGVRGRAQQWQLIHQPQGYYWASWNRTKNHLHPSCITSLLSSSVCLHILHNILGRPGFHLCLTVCSVLTSGQSSGLTCVCVRGIWYGKVGGKIVLVDR